MSSGLSCLPLIATSSFCFPQDYSVVVALMVASCGSIKLSHFLSDPVTIFIVCLITLFHYVSDTQASVYVTSLLFAACQEVSRIGGHTMER